MRCVPNPIWNPEKQIKLYIDFPSAILLFGFISILITYGIAQDWVLGLDFA